MIYITENGDRVLSLNDDEMSLLDWDENVLLELHHDGSGWTIQQSKCMTGKVVAGTVSQLIAE